MSIYHQNLMYWNDHQNIINRAENTLVDLLLFDWYHLGYVESVLQAGDIRHAHVLL